MVNELRDAFNEIAEMRSLPPEVVLEALQSALVSAYRRDAGASSAQQIEARIDPATGRARIYVEKEVTDDVFSPNTEVTLEKARFYNPEAEMGDMVMVQVEGTTKKFGRIAAQTAKQVILQKIREAERNSLYDEFIQREGDLMTGAVQSMNNAVVTLALGRAEAILPKAQQIPGERYRQHEKLRVYLLEVKRTNRGPQLICSRSHRNMLRRLLEYEVPEIYNGQVEIKSIAREAGHRSKVAVSALQEGIDPVGACVGMRGIRIQNIVKELHDEKIDVIEWSAQPETFISKALSPARVTGVYLEDDSFNGRTAVVVVPDDQLSLAIGREGQNARLAAKLTGWRIDIKSVTETVQGALENLDVPPISDVAAMYPQMVEDVIKIMDKRANNRAVMPEEFTVLGKFADLVERRLLAQRDEIRQGEIAQINAVKSTLPQELFALPLTSLDLSDAVLEALEPMENVGEVMLATLINEGRILQLVNKIHGDTLTEIQEALDTLMESDTIFSDIAEVEAAPEVEALEEAVVSAVEPVAQSPAEEAGIADAVADSEADESDEEVFIDAFGGEVIPLVSPDAESATEEEAVSESPAIEDVAVILDDVEDLIDEDEIKQEQRRKEKKKARELVFDEDKGAMLAKRRRKGNRKRNEWDDFDF